MKLENIEVGVTIGVRNNNPEAYKHYVYTTAVINEVSDTTFRTSPFGEFHKDTGKAVKTSFEAVTLEVVERNNFEYRTVQACTRLSESIVRNVKKLGESPEDRAVLDQVNDLLAARIKEIEKAQAAAELMTVEETATPQ